jgi:hypothetical protein
MSEDLEDLTPPHEQRQKALLHLAQRLGFFIRHRRPLLVERIISFGLIRECWWVIGPDVRGRGRNRMVSAHRSLEDAENAMRRMALRSIVEAEDTIDLVDSLHYEPEFGMWREADGHRRGVTRLASVLADRLVGEAVTMAQLDTFLNQVEEVASRGLLMAAARMALHKKIDHESFIAMLRRYLTEEVPPTAEQLRGFTADEWSPTRDMF